MVEALNDLLLKSQRRPSCSGVLGNGATNARSDK